jgi:RNA polymerase sigma factor (sigma-70 family)
VCLDRLASTTREQPAEDVLDDRLERTMEEIDEAFAVREALDELGDPCRELLDRFFARDESYRTIGEELDLPPGTIASRISRCLGKMRSQLEGRKPRASGSGGER